jgi:D-alanyl-D-alanine endopeptidase (penicillin-binding protein 7)
MSKKVFDFLSSFGVMILGVTLVFVCTISFSSASEKEYFKFPQAGPRNSNGMIDMDNSLPVSKPTEPIVKSDVSYAGVLTAFSAIAIDEQSDKILFEKNIDQIRPLASITKLMSVLVLLDLPLDWSSVVTVTADDYDDNSHQIKIGEVYSFQDLWYAALVASSNGSIKSLVNHSGLSEENFVGKMNIKAQEMNLSSMHFTDPVGLDSGNVGNARDTAELLRQALKFEKIKKALNTDSYVLRPQNSNEERIIYSTDLLLSNWIPNDFAKENIFGKTGYISDSRYNFAVNLKDKNKNSIIVVILGAETEALRFEEARDLAEWVFEEWMWE